jgi:membrane protein
MKTPTPVKNKKTFFKSTLIILKESFIGFGNDNILKLSAALAYYTIFSIAPMLIVVVGICSIFYGQSAVEGQVFHQISHLVGAETALNIQAIMQKTTLHSNNWMATIIGSITLLFGATSMFGEIQESINIIWGLKTHPKKGVIKFFINRTISFAMVVVLGFILLISLVLNALISAFIIHLKHYFSGRLIDNFYLVDYVILIIVIAVLFAFIFKTLPDAKIQWKDIWVSSLLTSVLFLLGKFLIGYYLEHNASITTYGAAGSIIILLLWVYYSSIILYFGAEFTQVYVKFKGRAIKPNKYAVWIEKHEVVRKTNMDIHEKLDSPAS